MTTFPTSITRRSSSDAACTAGAHRPSSPSRRVCRESPDVVTAHSAARPVDVVLLALIDAIGQLLPPRAALRGQFRQPR